MSGLVQVPQDLHIHTVFSHMDHSVVPEQTVALIAEVNHAKIIGISDHLECIYPSRVDDYLDEIRKFGLHAGIEVNGGDWAGIATTIDVEYYIYHCFDNAADYRGAAKLLATGKPVIIAHPQFLGTDLEKVPEGCYIEINNRYVWQRDWKSGYYTNVKDKFNFVVGSDAHQPNWLNQNLARHVLTTLQLTETVLF